MLILAIDTSTQWCSVALLQAQGGDRGSASLLFERHEDVGPAASQHVLDWVAEGCVQANIALSNIDALAIGIGPGAFTGIRIAVGVGQGLALGLNKPCIPIVSLDAMAWEAIKQYPEYIEQTICVASDARMQEIYWAYYQVNHAGVVRRLGDIHLSSPEDLAAQLDTQAAIPLGSAFSVYAAYFKNLPEVVTKPSLILPRARALAHLALDNPVRLAAEELEPLYIRNKVALTLAERGQAL